MKLLLVRHADPDYENDALTEKGVREAELLSERLAKLDVREYYCSPLGRARMTASYTLGKVGREAVICDWLREFDTVLVNDIKTGEKRLAWDQMPAYWTNVPEYYDKDKWTQPPMMRDTGISAAYGHICTELDRLLEKHGYRRSGNCYEAAVPNGDTVIMFCHFGVICVLLSHLLGLSPMVLWHGTVALPSSVTILCTEEREEGIAAFRMNAFGDTSHLYAHGEPPAFSGRFCEMFANTDERH